MAFVTDSFTDTDSTILQSHTGETGATWTEHPNDSGTDAKIISNAAKKDSAGAVSYYASGTPATNEYDVEVVCGFTTTSGAGAGCSGRLLTTANTGYLAWGSSNTVLYKLTAGTFGSIGAYASVWNSGTVVKLEIRTAAKSVYLDGGGTPVITNGDDTHTGTGRAGLRFYGNGGILESFSATDAVGGGTIVDLSSTTYSWTKNTQQLLLNSNFSASTLNFSAQSTQNTQVINTTTGTLTETPQSIQNRLDLLLTAATQTFTPVTIAISLSIGLGSAFLYFIGQGIEVTGAIAVVNRLLSLMGVGS